MVHKNPNATLTLRWSCGGLGSFPGELMHQKSGAPQVCIWQFLFSRGKLPAGSCFDKSCIWAMKHFGYLGYLGDNTNLLFGNYTCQLANFRVPLTSKPTSKIKYHKCHVFISSTQDKVKLKAFLVEDVQSQRSFVPQWHLSSAHR